MIQAPSTPEGVSYHRPRIHSGRPAGDSLATTQTPAEDSAIIGGVAFGATFVLGRPDNVTGQPGIGFAAEIV